MVEKENEAEEKILKEEIEAETAQEKAIEDAEQQIKNEI